MLFLRLFMCQNKISWRFVACTCLVSYTRVFFFSKDCLSISDLPWNFPSCSRKKSSRGHHANRLILHIYCLMWRTYALYLCQLTPNHSLRGRMSLAWVAFSLLVSWSRSLSLLWCWWWWWWWWRWRRWWTTDWFVPAGTIFVRRIKYALSN